MLSRFLGCYSLTCLFLTCCFSFSVSNQKIIAKPFSSFLYNFYGFRCYMQALCSFWVDFCAWCKIRVQIHFLACDCWFSQYSLLKKLFFPIVHSWPLCHKPINHIYMGLLLGSLFCSIDLCVCFYANTIALQYSLKSRSVMPPSFFFFKNSLAIFIVPEKFGILFYICEKCHWNFDRFGLKLYITLGSINILKY